MTPRRLLSPLKKFNKVAPSPGTAPAKGVLKFTQDEDTPLKSSSASLLEQNVGRLASSMSKSRPDSAPQEREDEQIRQGIPIDARVIINAGVEGVEVQEMEGSHEIIENSVDKLA